MSHYYEHNHLWFYYLRKIFLIYSTRILMLKFAPKNNKQLHIAYYKEDNIILYRLILSLAGHHKNINTSVWKYMLNYHTHYKPYSSFSRNRLVCTMTGRTRSVYRYFQLTRMKVRQQVGWGMFRGVAKSSW